MLKEENKPESFWSWYLPVVMALGWVKIIFCGGVKVRMGAKDIATSKTVWSAVGLLAYAVYLATQGDYGNALQTLLAALAAFGIRDAVHRNGPTVSAPSLPPGENVR